MDQAQKPEVGVESISPPPPLPVIGLSTKYIIMFTYIGKYMAVCLLYRGDVVPKVIK